MSDIDRSFRPYRIVALVLAASLTLTYRGAAVGAGPVPIAHLPSSIHQPSSPTAHRPPLTDSLVMKVDSAHRQIVLLVGPFNLPAVKHDNSMPGMAMGGMDMGHMATPLRQFKWPVSNGVHGFKVAVVDAKGMPVPRAVLHHFELVNFGRRALVHPIFERLAGAGKETADVALPPSITVPMDKGMPLGIVCMWHNDTGKDIDQVFLKLTLEWTPSNMVPAPIPALPIYVDVNEHADAANDYDLPAGRNERSFDFQLPISGRVLALGGHMHNYGVSVRLEDLAGAKPVTLTQLNAKLTPTGTIVAMDRKFYGASGEGMPLKADHKYRVVGTYQNPTGKPLPLAAMASFMGLFVPDVLAKWPKIDYNDPTLKQDMALLNYKPANR